MSDNSSISWTDATWNPIVGCSKVSAGCANCYAETMAGRLAAMNQRAYQDVVKSPGGLTYGPKSTWNGKTVLVESALTLPLRWKKPRRIFVCSMSDLFHETTPDSWIDRVFAVMALCPQHTFQMLTKRPERMAEYLNWTGRHYYDAAKFESSDRRYEVACAAGNIVEDGDSALDQISVGPWPLANVWLGTSVENQPAADERIPHLLKCPAAVRWLSVEPMLGAVVLPAKALERMKWCKWCNGTAFEGSGVKPCQHCCGSGLESIENPIGWVAVGHESGPKRRPGNIEDVRSIVRQCQAASVPVFVKQIDIGGKIVKDIAEFPDDLRVRQLPVQP
jgi:protein gp37